MRTPRLMPLALLMAANLFAQEQHVPSGRFYGPLVSGSWPKALKLRVQRLTRLTPQPASSPCSVPLLEAQIPKNVHFTIVKVNPAADKLAPMPQVKGLAPPCDSPSLP